eukprot:Em0001g1895a
MASCTGAVPIPTQMDCSLHKHVENLYYIRSKDSCNQPFNGQQLSPVLCQANSLVSHEAVDTENCVIIFSTTINSGESLYGGHLAIYMNNENQRQSPQLEPTLTVTLTHPTLGNISSRSMPTLGISGWQIFNVDPVLRGLPVGNHKIILELKAFWKEHEPMTCDEVGRMFLLDPFIGWQSKAWLEAHPDSTCLRPVLTAYTNGSLGVVPASASSGRGHTRRAVTSNGIHDYVQRLFKEIPSFRKLSCNVTFNGQQVSADVCRSDHIKTFKQLNNSCMSHGWTVAFNISLHEETVLGAQIVLYLNRSAANSTDPLLIQVHQDDSLLTYKNIPPSHNGWQLLNIEPTTQWWSDDWEVVSFTIRMFRGNGSSESLVPIECWEMPDWITLGAAEGSNNAGDESDALFAPIITVFANYVSVCHQPWPWLCLGLNTFGRRSIETERQLTDNSGTTSNNNDNNNNNDDNNSNNDNDNNNNNNRICGIKDRWIPSFHLTAALQSVSSDMAPYSSGGVVVLPKSLNVRQCTDQCPSGPSLEGSTGSRGLGTCCSPGRYGRAQMVMKRTDSSYLTTSLDSAVVEQCSPGPVH